MHAYDCTLEIPCDVGESRTSFTSILEGFRDEIKVR